MATVFITIWWIQRPIKPVVLTAQERAKVEEKLRRVEEPKPAAPTSPAGPNSLAPPASPGTPVPENGTRAVELPGVIVPAPQPNPGQNQPYAPGSKTIKFTQREINGLLNANTDLGRSVRLELDKDAINAYVAVPIPQDFPIGGGKMFRARGRFLVSIGNGGKPFAILEDVTVFGVSLPKAWLGGLKGENLIGDAMGQRKGAVLRGIKSLRVEPGALVLELED